MISCRTVPYAKHSFERALEGIASAGYSYVSFGNPPHQGIEVPDDDPGSIAQLGDMLAARGLRPLMLTGTTQFAIGQPFERAVARLDTAVALGVAEVLSNGISRFDPQTRRPVDESELAEDRAAFVDRYRRIAPEAADRGITITLKPHAGITATGKHIAGLIEDIGAPNVRACYDPGNVQFYTGVPALDDLPAVLPYLHSIVAKDHRGQAGDVDFPVPGDGDVGFPDVFAALYEAGFAGPVHVERIDGPDEPAAIDERVRRARIAVERMLADVGF